MYDGIAILICFLFGALAAYMDIASFFREKKLGVARIIREAGAMLFIAANGLIGLGFLLWSLSDTNAKINEVLPFKDVLGRGLVIGLSIPMLIRSKWFSIKQDGTSAAGIEAIYQWARIGVLHRVHRKSLGIKRRIARRYAGILEGRAQVPDRLLQYVLDVLEPFSKSERELDDLKAEYSKLAEAYAAQPASKEHLRELFVWAMDKCGIRSAESFLEDMAASA